MTIKNIIGGWRDDLMVKNISALAEDLFYYYYFY